MYRVVIRPAFFSTVRHLPGPNRDSILLGNMLKIGPRVVSVYTALVRQYGLALRYGAEFGVSSFAAGPAYETDILTPGRPSPLDRPCRSRTRPW